MFVDISHHHCSGLPDHRVLIEAALRADKLPLGVDVESRLTDAVAMHLTKIDGASSQFIHKRT